MNGEGGGGTHQPRLRTVPPPARVVPGVVALDVTLRNVVGNSVPGRVMGTGEIPGRTTVPCTGGAHRDRPW